MSKVHEYFEILEESGDEYLNFDKVENKLSSRRDLHAMMILDGLVHGTGNMLASASHDEIWLDIDEDQLERVITMELATELYRCGFAFREYGSLHMFV